MTRYSTATKDKKVLLRMKWKGLIQNGFNYLEQQDKHVPKEKQDIGIGSAKQMLENDNASSDNLLEAAATLTRLLGPGRFARWLSIQFENLNKLVQHPSILQSLNKLHKEGAMLLTTNYDDLIEKWCDLDPIDSSKPDDLQKFNQRLKDGVFHPHGYWEHPTTVVLNAINYYAVQHDDGVQETLRNILTGKTVLFVGCGGGLADPNFGKLLEWIGKRQQNIGFNHCLLLPKNEPNPAPGLPLILLYCDDFDDIGPWLEKLLRKEKVQTEGTRE